MPQDDPFQVVGGHHHAAEQVIDAQHRTLQHLRGTVFSLLKDGLPRFGKHEAKGSDEDDGSEEHYPQAEPRGE